MHGPAPTSFGSGLTLLPSPEKDPMEQAGGEGGGSPLPVPIGSLKVKDTFRKQKLSLPRGWPSVGKKENARTT